MKKLMTKHFSKWASKQKIHENDLLLALTEVQNGNFGVSLGGHIYKKRIKFKGQGKSGSGRTIICYKKGNRAIFIHGFSKNQKSNLSKKELSIFKELSRILLNFSTKEMLIAITNGDILEVKS